MAQGIRLLRETCHDTSLRESSRLRRAFILFHLRGGRSRNCACGELFFSRLRRAFILFHLRGFHLRGRRQRVLRGTLCNPHVRGKPLRPRVFCSIYFKSTHAMSIRGHKRACPDIVSGLHDLGLIMVFARITPASGYSETCHDTSLLGSFSLFAYADFACGGLLFFSPTRRAVKCAVRHP